MKRWALDQGEARGVTDGEMNKRRRRARRDGLRAFWGDEERGMTAVKRGIQE